MPDARRAVPDVPHRPRVARRGASRATLLLVVVVSVVVIVAFLLLRGGDRPITVTTAPGTTSAPGGSGPTRPPGSPATSPPAPAATAPAATAPAATALTAAALAALPKPRPRPVAYEGCPPEGDGGDRVLNALKARGDSAAWVDVPFETILALPWPEPIERRDRRNWPRSHAAEVARYEGAPVRVEGYFASGSTSGPESVNCHGAESDRRDWHVWLAPAPGPARQRSIVIEPTPQIRSRHAGWTLAKVRALARDSARVRVSGWLLFDGEHPEQIGRTRGTIWEIHPVLAIEVDAAGRWITLDDYVARRVRRATTTRPR